MTTAPTRRFLVNKTLKHMFVTWLTDADWTKVQSMSDTNKIMKFVEKQTNKIGCPIMVFPLHEKDLQMVANPVFLK